MKRFIVIFCFALCATTLYAKAIQQDMKRADEKARASYAFGILMGGDLRASKIEIDYAAFTDGLKAALEDSGAQISDSEAMEIVEAVLEQSREKQAEEGRTKEARYLAENAARPDVRTTASGLQYEVLVEGEGERPGPDSRVRVNYEGSLIDGTVFDSSYTNGEAVLIPMNQVIPGWAEGVALMSVGSKYRLYIPSRLAYGERGAGPMMPPYSTLIFVVELLEIVKPGSEAD